MQKLKIEVFGQIYSIKSDADPKYVKELAKYLDEKMRLIASKSKTLVSTNKITVLAAIHIVNDLFALKKEIEEQETLLEEKAEQILNSLEIASEDIEQNPQEIRSDKAWIVHE